MRFKNYSSAMKARRAYAGYGDTGCSSGFSPDSNGNCVSSSGQCDGCPGGCDSNGNCISASGGCVGCPGGCASDGTCLSTTSGGTTTSSGGGSSLATGIGSALTSIFGAKSPGGPQVSTASSIILPVVLGLGVVGGIVYFIKRKK